MTLPEYSTPQPPPPREAAINVPRVVVGIILTLAGIHLLRTALLSDPQNLDVLLRFAFTPARYWADLAPGDLPGGVGAKIWTPLTYAFLHADWMHVAVNCIWLAAFGTAVARRFGATRFLVFSAVTAMAGALAHYVALPNDGTLMIGASAAVSGQMAAAARFAFQSRPTHFVGRGAPHLLPALSFMEMFRNRTVVSFLAIWFAINLGIGLASGTFYGGAPIAWQAHLGGFVAGLVLFPLFDPVRGRLPPARPGAHPRDRRNGD